MMKIFNEWCAGTRYDSQQRDISGRMSKHGMDERKKLDLKAEWRYYNNYVDLVLALYGECMSKPTLEKEKGLANEILESGDIRKELCRVSGKINRLVGKTFDKPALDGVLSGAYQSLHDEINWETWQNTFGAMSTAEQIPFLYDITMALKKKYKFTEQPMLGNTITKDNMRMNVSTPNEDFYWSARARWANVPIWAAPSFTTQFMLRVAKEADATTDELQAFAYGIFAFWSLYYPHTATPVHRMYGVMTAAQDFGISPPACAPDTMYEHAVKFLQKAKGNLSMDASNASSSSSSK